MNDLDLLCETIKELTHDNNHNLARIQIAKYFKFDKIKSILKSIELISHAEKHTPRELIEYRRRKERELLDAVKQEYGEEVYQKIYNSL